MTFSRRMKSLERRVETLEWLVVKLALGEEILQEEIDALKTPERMKLTFKERSQERNMPLTPQAVNVHPDKIIDIAGAAKAADGSDIQLTNLAFTGSGAGVAGEDADPTDDNDTLDTAGVSVGATGSYVFSADGSDGKKYEAQADVTVVAPEVEVGEMSLTFTERVA